MSLLRFTASADTVITNAFQRNLTTRGTGSNLGASDILETFSIFAQASSSSLEAARILIKFPTEQIQTKRDDGIVPASGSVNFFLRLFNAPHVETTPEDFTLNILPVSQSWEEGLGLDHEGFTDLTRNERGANWIKARGSVDWATEGGDFLSAPTASQTFNSGLEDLNVDITNIVEQWLDGTIENHGVIIKLTSSLEDSTTRSYYTKKFFARGTEFFFKKPVIEARWDSSLKDNRGNFAVSSSLLTAEENLNTIYLYNEFRGELRNIPSIGTGTVFVNVFSESSGLGNPLNSTPITGGWVETGIYSASFALKTNEEVVYDVWFSGSEVYFTGTIEPKSTNANSFRRTSRQYVTNITNLKPTYFTDENARFRLFTRRKDFEINLFTVASSEVEGHIVEDVYYSIERIIDNEKVIPYGTGSLNHTRLSYDVSGSYFDFDMSLLEPGYMYELKFIFKNGKNFEQFAETFKFKLENRL